MIDTKIIVRQKKQGDSTGNALSGSSSIQQTGTDHALTADKAKRAEAADKAGYADSAGYAARAGYASKAGEIDENAEVLEKFIRKDREDSTEYLLRLLAGAVFGKYEEGLSGARIDKDGNAELGTLLTRLKATLAELQVEKDATVGENLEVKKDATVGENLDVKKDAHVGGNSTFDGSLSSPDFVSGFIGGRGWRIKNEPVTNAAGVQENKYTEEIDNLIVRGSMRIYEMIISQLLGENDNRIFTGMLEVDHYDPESGRVYLDTQGGKMYNPFRKDDYILVQQYNGMPSVENNHYVTKSYELIVTAVGTEGTGEDMLAWVTFRNFTSTMAGATAEELIRKKDTFVRVDNLSDPDRKGIIQLMTVGSDTPYMDIIYGLKTDPDKSLRGRLGNLKGIVHPIFGPLNGFGELLQNLYATGDLILRRTGESVDTKVEILQGQFATRFAQMSYEMSEDDNYLHNGQFLTVGEADGGQEVIDGWDVDGSDESMFWVDADGMPLLVNGEVTAGGNRRVTIDNNEGRAMLRIQDCGLQQHNNLIRQPGTHKEYDEPAGTAGSEPAKPSDKSHEVQDKLYVSLRIYANTAGKLTIGFSGCTAVAGKKNELEAKVIDLPYSGEWRTVEMEGAWNGTGDFTLRFTGDCHVSMVTITDRPLDNLKQTVSTQIKQTATNIKLLGENIDNVRGTVTQMGIDIDAMDKSIRIYVDDQNERLDERITSEINVQAGRIDLINKWQSSTSSKISSIETDINSIRTTVGNAATMDDLDRAKSTLQNTINSNYNSLADDIRSARKHADDVGQGIRDDYETTITYVEQNKDAFNVAAGAFDKNGRLVECGGLTVSAMFTNLFNQRVNLDKDGNVTNISKSGLVVTSDFAKLESKVTDMDGRIVDEASITTMIENNISTAVIKASQIKLEGYTTINKTFAVDEQGTMSATAGTIGGLKIEGNALTNEGFDNDAYIIMRNDSNKVFAGIGGNVLPGSSGIRAVARFENNNNDGFFGSTNIGVVAGASGAYENIALDITGGCIAGLRMKVASYSSSATIAKGVNMVHLMGEGTYTLPMMKQEDDGYVVYVKRTLPGDTDTKIKLKANTCIDSSGKYYTGFFHYDNDSVNSEMAIQSCGDAMIFVYMRDIGNTGMSSSIYKGCWVQFKCPRKW